MTEKMDNLVKYEIPIYGGEFWIGFADNFVRFAMEFDVDLSMSSNGCSGLSFRKIDGHTNIYIMLIQPDKIRPDLIAHEALHICNFVFEDRGVNISLKDDEHQAYFMDWIIEQAFEAIWQTKQQINIRCNNQIIPLVPITLPD